MKINDLEREAESAILQCFQEIPFLETAKIDQAQIEDNEGAEYRVDLEFPTFTRRIIVEVKSNGEPRKARVAVHQLQRYLSASQADYGLFVAPYISPRAAEICQEGGVGYVDLAGNCHLSFDEVYIHKRGFPNPYTRERYLRSLFSPKAERILRVLLSSRLKDWKVEELANEADVSLGQVSNVKKLLDDQEWIDSKTVGFSLTDPQALLQEWSQNYRYKRNKITQFYTMLAATEFEARLHEVCRQENIRYGLTGFSGSIRYAPAVRYQRVMAYVADSDEVLLERLDMKPVESGANVLLLKPYDEGVFYGSQIVEGVAVVSPIQIYLDLQSYRGRGKEAADILLERVVEEVW